VKLRLDPVRAERDASLLLVRHNHAIWLGNIDCLNLKPALQNLRRRADQIECGLGFILIQRLTGLIVRSVDPDDEW
jgi:hypothetical protein